MAEAVINPKDMSNDELRRQKMTVADLKGHMSMPVWSATSGFQRLIHIDLTTADMV